MNQAQREVNVRSELRRMCVTFFYADEQKDSIISFLKKQERWVIGFEVDVAPEYKRFRAYFESKKNYSYNELKEKFKNAYFAFYELST